MSFGLTIEKLFLIGLVALFVVGPDRLPTYAAQFARLITRLRDLARGAEVRLKEELGDESIEELKKLDPRQYDPRRIVRDVLSSEPEVVASTTSVAPKTPVAQRKKATVVTPFDGEST